MASKREIVLFTDESVIAAAQVVRSSPVSCRDADNARLLLKVSEIGSPAVGDTLTVRPIFYDEKGNEYLDGNTTYGTFTLTGSDTPCNVTVNIPFPAVTMAVKVTGAGSLSSSTGFIITGTLIPIASMGK
jgi:hypothetical protein